MSKKGNKIRTKQEKLKIVKEIDKERANGGLVTDLVLKHGINQSQYYAWKKGDQLTTKKPGPRGPRKPKKRVNQAAKKPSEKEASDLAQTAQALMGTKFNPLIATNEMRVLLSASVSLVTNHAGAGIMQISTEIPKALSLLEQKVFVFDPNESNPAFAFKEFASLSEFFVTIPDNIEIKFSKLDTVLVLNFFEKP